MEKVLTILVPVYNTEKYINRCLDSILLEEVLDDIEVIAVSDGSKDGSVDIIKEYVKKYPNTLKLIEKENGGHGSTINKGLEIATSKYFRVLDSDDWFDSCEFIKYINLLKEANEDIVLNNYYEEYVYNGNRQWFGYKGYKYNKTYKFSDIDLESDDYFAFVMASITYKTSNLKESNLKLFEKTFYVDMQYIVEPLLCMKTFRFLDINLYRYFIGRPEQSMSNDNLIKHYEDHEKVLKRLIDFYNSNLNNFDKAKKEYIKRIISTMMFTYTRIICILLNNRVLAYKTIRKFNKYLKNKNIEIYYEFKKIPYIKYSSKICFLNVLLFNKLFERLLILARTIKWRLKK